MSEQQLITDLSQELVTQIAPQELPLFRAHAAVYFQDPAKAGNNQQTKDEMLGFGTGEAVVLLTPFVLTVTNEVVKFIAAEIKKTTKEESASLIAEMVKSLFKKFRPEAKQKAPPLTPAQLAAVREAVLEQTRLLKLSESRSNLLADAIAGSLVISSPKA